ncbi:MAG: serine/threonine protein kinase [Streptosporangiaceae bacterium]|nr:serine/threonine protein kinase [Streptosporangiaceae bacterium]
MPTSVDRYRIDRVLGSGAFASVWLGHDDALAAQVAIKVLSGSLLDDLDVRSRFLEEARILRRADSERLVRVHDIGELPDGRPYFVMSYADRGTLAERMRGRPLPVGDALAIAVEIAYGVEVINRLGVIHRDLKPSNVLFQSTPDGGERLLIADLGLAKALAHASGSFTLPVGTPGYMSPEQARFGGGLDVRADVYGLGALTYHMLTGRPPSPAPEKRAPSELRPVLGPQFDQVVLRALEQDREKRFQTAEAFAQALATLRPPTEGTAPPDRGPDGTPGPPPPPVPEPPGAETAYGTPGPPPPLDDAYAPRHGGSAGQDQITTTEALMPADGGTERLRQVRSDGTAVLQQVQGTEHQTTEPRGHEPGPHGHPRHSGPQGPDGPVARPDARRGAKHLLIPGGISTAILAVAVIGGLVLGSMLPHHDAKRTAASPAKRPDPNYVTVSDPSGKLTVTVPKEWPKQPRATWVPTEVALADAQQRPVLRATPDFTGFRTPARKTPGLFIGMTTDVRPGELPPRTASHHAQCVAGQPENYARGNLQGTITKYSRCASGTPSVTEIGLTDTGGGFGLWIRIKQVGAKDLTQQILNSLQVKGP